VKRLVNKLYHEYLLPIVVCAGIVRITIADRLNPGQMILKPLIGADGKGVQQKVGQKLPVSSTQKFVGSAV